MACEILDPDPSAIGQIILVSRASYVPVQALPSSLDGARSKRPIILTPT
jgi:hypothetical protein